MPTQAAAEALLADAMARYREDPARGDLLIHCACAQAADPLPLKRIAYKFYNRQRRFALAGDFARAALREAAARAGLPEDYARWTAPQLAQIDAGLASHVLLALKAMAFIGLRAGDEAAARPCLEQLARLDPADGSGVSVVAAMMASLDASTAPGDA